MQTGKQSVKNGELGQEGYTVTNNPEKKLEQLVLLLVYIQIYDYTIVLLINNLQ